ncbi:hypothetical protein EF294_07510 [Gordonia oryzae]|uniref:Uncharacterized protein n=1 Tax=Gordonia oryzae TaxID=2487349 RepID=A0A3N4GQ05_9ACTN|nr:hypothetical protein EF294_07510 [Gordonia oryzae]
MRLRDLGKPWFAWADLRAIVRRANTDPRMELHRAVDPNWQWNDPTTRLLGEIATVQSERRYFAMSQLFESPDDIPKMYWMAIYGPKDSSEQVASEPDGRPNEVDEARAVAAGFRKR